MRILITKEIGVEEVLRTIRSSRAGGNDPEVEARTRAILNTVRREGDQALLMFLKQLDGVILNSLEVPQAEMKRAYASLSPILKKALKASKQNIEKFHRSTLRRKESVVKTAQGVEIWREFRPIERVGLYAPGGKAAYPSTVLMLGIPAMIAGCQEIVLCTPPGKNGQCNPAVLGAAYLCGITRVFKSGGAAAIAAMAYGTETIPKVSKIFGPGNQYVTKAKMLVYGEVDIDMPAGPSEVLVLADEKANPRWVAADLLSQLEHGEDSQSILVTLSRPFADKVIAEMRDQMQGLSRADIMEKSFEKSFAVVARSLDEACRVVNEYAPEHLEIVMKNESGIVKKINNAGSIFMGSYTNEPLGDYATGANHTLPTSGFAKMFPALSTESFGKMVQVQRVSEKGIKNLKFMVETLASAEGLDAHRNAVAVRFS